MHHGLSQVSTCAPLACCLIFLGFSVLTDFLFRSPKNFLHMVFWARSLRRKHNKTNLEISFEEDSSADSVGLLEIVIMASHFFMVILPKFLIKTLCSIYYCDNQFQIARNILGEAVSLGIELEDRASCTLHFFYLFTMIDSYPLTTKYTSLVLLYRISWIK